MKRMFFSIQRQEWGPLKWVILQSVGNGIAKIFMVSAASALFLDAFGAKAFPFLYLATGVFLPLLGVVLLRFEKGVSYGWYLRIVLLSLLVVVAALRLGLLLTDNPFLIGGLALFIQVVAIIGGTLVGGAFARLFDVRTGKRLYGLVGASEVVASLLAGLLAPAILPLVGINNLFWLVVAGLGLQLMAVHNLSIRFKDRLEVSVENNTDQDDLEAQRTPASRGYILTIFGLSILMTLAYYVAENMLFERMEARLDNVDEFGGFLAKFLGVASLLGLIARLSLNWIWSKFGLAGGLLVQPLFMGAAILPVALVGTMFPDVAWVFWLVAMSKLLERTFANSTTRSSIYLLFQPLPAAQRTQYLTTTNSIVEPVAVGISGAVLLVLMGPLQWGVVGLSWALIVMLVAWIILALVARQQYLSALINALSKRSLGEGELRFDDPAIFQLLQQKLASEHEGEVLYSMHLMQTAEMTPAPRNLLPLLRHPAPEVRKGALSMLESEESDEVRGAVEQVLYQDNDPIIRGRAAQTLMAVAGEAAAEKVGSLLTHKHPEIRDGAMIGLFRHGGIEGVVEAGSHLIKLRQSTSADDRTAAAAIIGSTGIQGFERPLITLANDLEVRVRRAALRSCGQLKTPRLWDQVLQLIDLDETRAEAIAALIEIGPPALDAVVGKFDREDTSQATQLALVHAVSRSADRDVAGEFLWPRRRHLDTDVRHAVLDALVQRKFTPPPDEHREVVSDIEAESGAAATAYRALASLSGEPVFDALRAAIDEEIDSCKQRLFCLLSLIYPPDALLQIRTNYYGATGEKRAYALEILDNLLAVQEKQWVIPILEDQGLELRRQKLQHFVGSDKPASGQCLEHILSGGFPWPTRWIKATALRAIGRCGLDQFKLQVRLMCRETAEVVVRDAALWSLWELCPDDAATEAASLQLNSAIRGPAETLRVLTECGQITPGLQAGIGLVPRTETLGKVDIFARVPVRWLVSVAELVEFRALKKGEPLMKAGDVGDEMYILVAGSVRVHRERDTLAELGAGAIVGEMSVLDPEQRSASVTAITDIDFYCIRQGPLQEVIGRHPQVSEGILRVLVQRLRSINQRGKDVSNR